MIRAIRRRERWLSPLMALAVVATSCGGGGEAVESWVADVCSGMTSWVEELEERSEGLNDELEGLEEGDSEGVKEVTVAFLGDAVAATERLIERIDEAGVPAVEDGREVADTFLEAIGQVRDVFAEVQDGVGELSTEDPEAFRRALEDFASSIQDNTAAAVEVFSEAQEAGLGGPELDQAFENEPACKALG